MPAPYWQNVFGHLRERERCFVGCDRLCEGAYFDDEQSQRETAGMWEAVLGAELTEEQKAEVEAYRADMRALRESAW